MKKSIKPNLDAILKRASDEVSQWPEWKMSPDIKAELEKIKPKKTSKKTTASVSLEDKLKPLMIDFARAIAEIVIEDKIKSSAKKSK